MLVGIYSIFQDIHMGLTIAYFIWEKQRPRRCKSLRKVEVLIHWKMRQKILIPQTQQFLILIRI